jgi:hypothetical protein
MLFHFKFEYYSQLENLILITNTNIINQSEDCAGSRNLSNNFIRSS